MPRLQGLRFFLCSLLSLIGLGCALFLAEAAPDVQPAPQPTPGSAQTQTAVVQSSCDPDELVKLVKNWQACQTAECRKKSPVTAVAFLGFLTIAITEENWKEVLGKYATLEQLGEGYRGKVAGGTASFDPLKFEEGTDPRRLPGYEFSLNVSSNGNRLEMYQTQRKPGLPAFFFDGEKIYCNPKGRASSRDTLLGTPTEIVLR